MMPYPGQLMIAFGHAGGRVVMFAVSSLDLKQGSSLPIQRALHILLRSSVQL
jgi:hypothetical protein